MLIISIKDLLAEDAAKSSSCPEYEYIRMIWSYNIYYLLSIIPKGLRAESARDVTGRRCPNSGNGEDFLTSQLILFTETAVTPEQKVEKSFPRSEINRHAEG